jgi:hypothetical protein
VLFWGRTHGVTYHLQVPDERGLMRLRIRSETAGDGGVDDITGLEASTRLLRLNVVSKSDPDSMLELREIEVYGVKAPSAVGRPDATGPVRSGLLPNFPNPFNPVTEVRWSLAERGRAAVSVFDARGRRVAVLADGILAAGPHRAAFDAAGLPSGIYVCRLRAGAVRESRKMLLIR